VRKRKLVRLDKDNDLIMQKSGIDFHWMFISLPQRTIIYASNGRCLYTVCPARPRPKTQWASKWARNA
jgi:hypothetical protein